MGPAVVSSSGMLAKLFQLWFAYVLLCHGAHILLGEHDCPAARRMLVYALQASSAAEVVGFGRWFGKESNLCLSAPRLFSLYTGINSMICCRKGVHCSEDGVTANIPANSNWWELGQADGAGPMRSFFPLRAGDLCFLCGLSTRSGV